MIPNAPEPKLQQLYQDVILDHNRNPRNFRELTNATQYAHGYNPLCGDDFHLYLNVDAQGTVQEVGFQGNGCAISKSSASLMTTFVKGKTVAEAEALKDSFLELLTKEPTPAPAREKVGRLVLFEGVKEFPVRVKCATLIWHTLADVLKDAKAGKK